ncbi:MAG: AAA family ATPase [Schwartzia sp.]|nr:AAA family ATPase [Schwartzia sp. (in: firmicutes)]
MDIERETYLSELRLRERNGMAKVITGPRRAGKPWLLFRLFYRDLIARGIDASHIICVALDDIATMGIREFLLKENSLDL